MIYFNIWGSYQLKKDGIKHSGKIYMDNIEVIVYISAALLFLIYSIRSYQKKNIIYTIRNEKMSVIKNDYYNLQLLFCIANCSLLILESVIGYNMENTKLLLLYYLATFWLLNFLLKIIALKMKYLNIEGK